MKTAKAALHCIISCYVSARAIFNSPVALEVHSGEGIKRVSALISGSLGVIPRANRISDELQQFFFLAQSFMVNIVSFFCMPKDFFLSSRIFIRPRSHPLIGEIFNVGPGLISPRACVFKHRRNSPLLDVGKSGTRGLKHSS